MSRIKTKMTQSIQEHKGDKVIETGQVNVSFTPNMLAQFAYYKCINVCEYIDFNTLTKEQAKELCEEFVKMLVEVGEERKSRFN